MLMAALDFVRALHDRPRIFRWLFKIAVGRYAYREYQIFVWGLDVQGYDPFWGYDLEDMDYHHGKFYDGEKEYCESVGI